MNEILTLAVDALAHDGRGIARLAPGGPAERTGSAAREAGTVVFVAGALPGQIVRARAVRRKARLMEAVLVDVLRPAPDAIPPLCPHQQVCGGCALQTMPYARQLHWKRQLALGALTRIGRLDQKYLESALEAVHPSPDLLEFRNKMEFAFGLDPRGGLILGLRRRGGPDTVPVPGCVLMPPEAQDIIEATRELAARSGLAPYASRGLGCGSGIDRETRPARGRVPGRGRGKPASVDHGFWRFLVLRRGQALDDAAPRWWALCITSPGDAARRASVRALGEKLLESFPSLAAFIHEERRNRDNLAAGERRVLTLDERGRERPEAALLHLPLGGRLFGLDAASFFQVNTGAAQTLARLAGDMLAPESVPGGALLDLYCGVGAPGLILAPAFERLLGLECDARAVALARGNAERMGFAHCRYLAEDAAALGRLTEKGGQVWDAALIDPPRAGLAPRALDGLLRLAPRRMLYISCNPATLARDAALMSPLYGLERLAVVDLFPHTPHLECLSLWRRKA